jgi:phosphopantothenoylcysteine decarboxylase/phosphopantothenate--cysteine ligase
VRDAYPGLSVIGFKAEAYISEDELIARAKDSMKDVDLDMVVANEVGTSGMGTIENDVYIIPAENGDITHVSGNKRLIAEALADNIEDMLTKRELNVH